jgi:3-hydroxybutyryl-CoA dehydrogenase
MQRVVVVGGGIMGNGIAQVIATAGLDVTLVDISAAALDLDVKRRMLAQLDEALRDDVVIASNTSQFSISLLAAATSRPDRVIGSHWFNPPPVMQLIEIIRGVETSDSTLATTVSLAER